MQLSPADMDAGGARTAGLCGLRPSLDVVCFYRAAHVELISGA